MCSMKKKKRRPEVNDRHWLKLEFILVQHRIAWNSSLILCILFTIFLTISIWKKVGIVGVKVDMKNNSRYTLVQLFVKNSRSREAILLLIVVLNPQCAIQFEFCIILLLTNVFTTLVGKWKFKYMNAFGKFAKSDYCKVANMYYYYTTT